MAKKNLIIGIVVLIALVGGIVLWQQKNNQQGTKQQINKEVVEQTQGEIQSQEQKATQEQRDEQNQVKGKDVKFGINNSQLKYNKDGNINTSEWKTYQNKELGVEFKYPDFWGDIKEWRQQGCYDDVKNVLKVEMLTKDDKCFHIALKSEGIDKLFFATSSRLYHQNPVPRGGYWGDESGKIADDNYVKNLCNNEKRSCLVYNTASGITVAKRSENVTWGDAERYSDIYYIHSKHPVYKGLIITPERLPYDRELGADIIEEIIDSLKFF